MAPVIIQKWKEIRADAAAPLGGTASMALCPRSRQVMLPVNVQDIAGQVGGAERWTTIRQKRMSGWLILTGYSNKQTKHEISTLSASSCA